MYLCYTVHTQETERYRTMHKALFLDRDGTLVHRKDYPRRPEDLILFDGIGPALKSFQDADWKLVVVTNQGGVALGYFTAIDLLMMHEYLAQSLAAFGVRLDGIYDCPHHPRSRTASLQVCECRKPKPGMLRDAAIAHAIDLAQSWMLGDMASDIEAGRAAGCKTAFIGPSYPPADITAPTTVEALTQIRDREQI